MEQKNQSNSTEKVIICPLMSCRLISKDNTPVVAKCQRENCAWWDIENHCCIIVGIKIEVVHHGK